MKTPRAESFIQATLLCVALCIATTLAGCLTGCTTTPTGEKKFLIFNASTNSIENKGYFITQLAVTEVLRKHDPEKVIPKLIEARRDLATLEASETISVWQVNEIIQRLPADTFSNPNTRIAISGGLMVFSDELESVAAKNPQELRSGVRGMGRSLDGFIPKQ